MQKFSFHLRFKQIIMNKKKNKKKIQQYIFYEIFFWHSWPDILYFEYWFLRQSASWWNIAIVLQTKHNYSIGNMGF